MDRAGRDEVDVAGLERHWWLAIDLVLHPAFEDIDDLFARMRVPGGCYAGVDVNAHLDGFAPWGAEVVSLKIGASDGRLRRLRCDGWLRCDRRLRCGGRLRCDRRLRGGGLLRRDWRLRCDRRLPCDWRLLRQRGAGDGEGCESDCGDNIGE